MMEMELVSRETIKPSSPTPSHLRIYPLSFLDNIVYRNYIPLLYFYNQTKDNDQNFKISQLRKSLSQLLSKYYPFAGRLKDKITIECNDHGVSFLVAKIKNNLSEILQNPTEKLLNSLFPDELQWKDMDWSDTLIAIQINGFSCGGMAISICMSHKIGDAATLFNFMNDWSIINQKLHEEDQNGLLALLPFDGGASVFPQKDLPIFPELVHIKRENNVVCKRFVFQPSMIKLLKAMVNSSSVDLAPTRVQLVMAWIYKRAVSIMGLDFKTALFTMAVDLRKRMVPPLSEKCVGNIVWISSMFADKEEMELEDLVCKIKEGLSEFCDVYPKMFGGKEKEHFSMISEWLKQVTGPLFENENSFNFSSWCKFPMYEADFGWGKPTWVTTFGCSSRKVILLMDTRDGDGIEAVLNMEENDMAKFEHDVELLQNASLKSY